MNIGTRHIACVAEYMQLYYKAGCKLPTGICMADTNIHEPLTFTRALLLLHVLVCVL